MEWWRERRKNYIQIDINGILLVYIHMMCCTQGDVDAIMFWMYCVVQSYISYLLLLLYCHLPLKQRNKLLWIANSGDLYLSKIHLAQY